MDDSIRVLLGYVRALRRQIQPIVLQTLEILTRQLKVLVKCLPRHSSIKLISKILVPYNIKTLSTWLIRLLQLIRLSLNQLDYFG